MTHHGLKLYMVGLVVDDMETTLDFYRLLGLDVPKEATSTHVEVEMPGGMVLFFDSKPEAWDPDHQDSPFPDPGRYRSILEFYLESEAAVRAKYLEMTGHGYRGVRAPYQTSFGMCFAFVADPDSHTILLSGNSPAN